MMFAFVPITVYLIPVTFFVLGVVAFLAALAIFWLLAQTGVVRQSSVKTFYGSAITLSLLISGLVVWSLWPRIYSESEVKRYARPGVDIQLVLSRVGSPSEHIEFPDGSESFLYATGLMTGYVVVDTDPVGTITDVYYAD